MGQILPATRQKISESLQGHTVSLETRRKIRDGHVGLIPWNKGKKGVQIPSRETRSKMSKSANGHFVSLETKQKISKANKGKIHSIENRKKQSGKNCHFWKGGVSSENQIIRHRIEYRLWRESVFARDNWRCQNCMEKGGELQAHHIKAFSKHPELRYAIDNGVTLCIGCHRTNHPKIKLNSHKKNKNGNKTRN